MPRRPATDVIHAAITDHRILKRPLAAMPAREGLVLTAWQPPPAELARRNLGLACFRVARQTNSPGQFQRAYTLLSPELGDNDPEVSAVLGYLSLGAGRSDAAIGLFEAATHSASGHAEYWLDLGVAEQSAAHVDQAAEAFNKAIELDPYDYRPYQALAELYRSKKPALARQTLARFLELVPQSLTIRLLEAR
jgi:tetratricopeptide (TPR) repeat protein